MNDRAALEFKNAAVVDAIDLAPTVGQPETIERGVFTARVASFNTVNSYNDRLLPGSFKAALAAKAAAGKRIAILWNHNSNAPPIGATLDAYEDPRGLVVTGAGSVGCPRPFGLEGARAAIGQRVLIRIPTEGGALCERERAQDPRARAR